MFNLDRDFDGKLAGFLSSYIVICYALLPEGYPRGISPGMILLSQNKVAARIFRLEIRFINTFANIRQLQREVRDVQMTLQLLVPSPNVNTPNLYLCTHLQPKVWAK